MQAISLRNAPDASFPADGVWGRAMAEAAWIAAAMAGNSLLFVVARDRPAVATLHALAVAGVGMWWALDYQRPQRLAALMMYMAGSEVLWRMSQAWVPWEFAKLVLGLLIVTSLVRRRAAIPAAPLAYVALLLPSIPLTFAALESDLARQALTFNLAAPVLMALAIWFFSGLQFTEPQLLSLLRWQVHAAVGLLGVALVYMLQADALEFGNESNTATSGGYGPNQVAAVLGLGLACSWLVALLERRMLVRGLYLGVGLLCGMQAALTFSRAGLYLAGVALLGAICHLVRNRRQALQVAVLACAAAAMVVWAILPALDEFTSGALGRRFETVSSTGRDSLAAIDLDLWFDNPLLGVGPGISAYYHRASTMAAHTEYTRLLAEHGVFGLLAIGLLGYLSIRALVRQAPPRHKAMVTALLLWGLAFLLVNGMRLALAPMAIGLAFVGSQAADANPPLSPGERGGIVPGLGMR